MRQLLIVNIIIFNRKTYEKGGVSCDDVGLAVRISWLPTIPKHPGQSRIYQLFPRPTRNCRSTIDCVLNVPDVGEVQSSLAATVQSGLHKP